jgi:Tfp pilus assembly PilM family ATPase
MDLPVDISQKELNRAVELEVSKKIPLNPASYYFDFKVVSKNNDFQEILYAASPKGVVSETSRTSSSPSIS